VRVERVDALALFAGQAVHHLERFGLFLRVPELHHSRIGGAFQEIVPALGTDQDHGPALHPQSPAGQIGVLRREVRTVVAPLIGERPCVFERDIYVPSVFQGDDDLALDVDLHDVGERDAELLLDLANHERLVVERLTAHEADDELDGTDPALDPFRRELPDGGGLTRHPHHRDVLQLHLRDLLEGKRRGAVRVTGAGGLNQLFSGGHDTGFVEPRNPFGRPRDGGAVELSGVQCPGEEGGDRAPVLSFLQDRLVGGARQRLVEVAALGLFLAPALAAEEVFLDDVEGGSQPQACHGAQRASLFSVDAVVEGRARVELHGVEVAQLEDLVRAGDDARGAAAADLGGHDLRVEVLPVLAVAALHRW
jgi:hypothetical protein